MADEEAQETKPAARDEKAPARPATALSTSTGHAIVVAAPAPPATPSMPKVSRRQMVIGAWWAGLLGLLGVMVASFLNFFWNRTASSLTGTYILDVNANDIEPGGKQDVVILVPNGQNPLLALEAKVFIARLDETQANRNPGSQGKAGAFLALSRKCPHLGCTVPYVESFTFTDPLDGQSITGWFRCPCHGSTYSDTGRRVFGPAPRSMDLYQLSIAEDGTMTVNLDAQLAGTADNGAFAVQPGEEPAI